VDKDTARRALYVRRRKRDRPICVCCGRPYAAGSTRGPVTYYYATCQCMGRSPSTKRFRLRLSFSLSGGPHVKPIFLLAVVLCCCLPLITLCADTPAWSTIAAPPSVSSPASVYAVQADLAAAAAEKPAAATKSFKSALDKAAVQAFKSKKISRWDLARIRMAIAFRPAAMAEAQACCIDQAVNDGVIRSGSDGAADGFDWTNLLAFLEGLLPLILELIKIFSV